ncbi:hypothetical protein NMY22_g8883 [Coprinellus aureogranulatus]|nr:hypothetical protein NMY22_g8883 [Coprinellus aureogranulatus]
MPHFPVNRASEIVSQLQQIPLCSSQDAIFIDDLTIHALFAPCKNVHKSGKHVPQTLSLSFTANTALLEDIYNAFEERKASLDLKSTTLFFAASKSVKMQLVRGNGEVRQWSRARQRLLEWCICAYAMLVSPDSHVRLRVLPMGPFSHKGFAVTARYDIPKLQYLWELVGLMPGDNDTAHSDLSAITPFHEQDQPVDAERVLFGPLRLVNHRCKEYNIEFMAIPDCSAFVAYAVRDIVANEELTANYGSEWFGQIACPCLDCSPSLAQGSSSNQKPPAALEVRSNILKLTRTRKTEVQVSLERESKLRLDPEDAVRQNKRKRNKGHRRRRRARQQGSTDEM